ncbi:MAG: ABC-F family ATP-binding cassette domain-containing protein [Lactovum sp.]
MIVLQGNKLSRSFAGEVLFENISLNIQERSRIALVGKNGSGKSTLLKIIVAEEEATTGNISKIKDLSIGYLAQHTGLDSNLTVFKELETVFSHLIIQELELRKMEEKMAILSAKDLAKLMQSYDSQMEAFKENSGFTYLAEIKSILNAFQFPEIMWNQEVTSLSGGQKTRLALAKMLLLSPDLLVLDEPTNHLDIETLAWLENYLQSYKGALLIVSHDRYFLDHVVKEVYELSRGQMKHYSGNYSYYLEKKEQDLITEENEYNKQQKEIANLEEFVAKNLVRASTTKRAQSRRKQLEKMERLAAPVKSSKRVNLTFSSEHSSGNEVLNIRDLSIGYDSILSKNINLNLRKFESIAIVGANGIGKSTFLKSLIGKIPYIAGEVKIGANVSLGYYDQEQKGITQSNTVLEELWSDYRMKNEVDIRNVLGSFLFSGEDVKKTVGMLSGGEKARLLLAKLSMQHDNFLVLDEPTNHLDIESREVLEQALIEYDGSLLFVSHDRYFINRVASQIFEISEEGAKLYPGDYDYYLEKKSLEAMSLNETEKMVKLEKNDDRQEQKNKERSQRKRERELAELEQNISGIEMKISCIQEKMVDLSSDFIKLNELQKEIDGLMAERDKNEERWLELLEEE